MGRKSKYTIEEKVQAVQDYKTGKRGTSQICNDLGLCKSSRHLRYWVHQYDKYGEIAFLPKKSNKAYTKEFKEIVVQEYLDGEGSLEDLAIKYDIPSSETLRKWIISYNSHEEEMYSLKKYDSLEELREDIIQYIYFYNYERLQERFDDRTPMAVRNAALTAENVTQYPIKENRRIQKYYANLKSKQEQYSIA